MARGDCSFVAGHDNTCSSSYMGYHCGGIVLGNNNSCEPADGTNMGICIGNSNGFYQGSGQICIGSNNLMKNTVKTNAIVIGFYNEGQKNCVQIGNYADSSTLPLNSTKFIVGCGASAVRHQNAIECSTGVSAWTGNSDPITLIKYNFGLNNATSANKAFVNAITPPLDPNNVTADDMTLVTKSHLTYEYSKVITPYHEELTNAYVVPIDGSSFDITSLTGALPSWAKSLVITFHYKGQTFDKEVFLDANIGVHLDVIHEYITAVTELEHYHIRIDWNAATTSFEAKAYWAYNHELDTNTITSIDNVLANAGDCKIVSIDVWE